LTDNIDCLDYGKIVDNRKEYTFKDNKRDHSSLFVYSDSNIQAVIVK
jgi:hypothetical protein